MRVRTLKLAASALALIGSTIAGAAQGAPPVAPAEFDFYVLTLSWSPGFCDLNVEKRSSDQCAAGSGDAFVVHGLWPNNRRRADPQNCEGGDDPSRDALAGTRGLYPSEGLAAYEYRKHGSCTGLGASDYFAAVGYARDQIAIPAMLQSPSERQRVSPDAIEEAFVAANPNLSSDNMAVTCARGELVDVRLCLSKDLKAFAACPKVSGHTCQRGSIAIAPVR